MISENKKAKSGKFSIEMFVCSEEALLTAILQCVMKGRAETVAGELLSRFGTLENVLSADLKVNAYELS